MAPATAAPAPATAAPGRGRAAPSSSVVVLEAVAVGDRDGRIGPRRRRRPATRGRRPGSGMTRVGSWPSSTWVGTGVLLGAGGRSGSDAVGVVPVRADAVAPAAPRGAGCRARGCRARPPRHHRAGDGGPPARAAGPAPGRSRPRPDGSSATGGGTTGCSSVVGSSGVSTRSKPSGSAAGLGAADGGAAARPGHGPAEHLAGGPGRDLTGEVARARRALVVVEGEPADGVEVARHPGGDLGGSGHTAGHARGGTQPGAAGAERPQTGEAGIRQGDDTDGVAAGGVLGLGAVLADPHGGGLEAAQADVALRACAGRPRA